MGNLLFAIAVLVGLGIAIPTVTTSIENAAIIAYQWTIASILSLVA